MFGSSIKLDSFGMTEQLATIYEVAWLCSLQVCNKIMLIIKEENGRGEEEKEEEAYNYFCSHAYMQHSSYLMVLCI